MAFRVILGWVSVGLLMTSCQWGTPLPNHPGSTIFPTPVVHSLEFTRTPAPSSTVVPEASSATQTSPEIGSSSTPDPYEAWTVDYLSARKYGGGALTVEGVLGVNSYFTRTLISYPSDGLTIFGFMDVPKGDGSFPVVVALHGYIDPAIYQTLDYTTAYADTLARAGYLVIHPNLRGYRPSDSGENLFRVGMAIDVLNLIQLIKDQGGQAGPLEKANPSAIGMWGHSMGGGITLRVLTVSPDIKAAVLYAAMSGDEYQNFTAIGNWSNGGRGQEERQVPVNALERISPIHYLDRIQAAVSINHGKSDELVPIAWSIDLCQRLGGLNKTVECHYYPGQPHTFHPDGGALLAENIIAFYNKYLAGK